MTEEIKMSRGSGASGSTGGEQASDGPAWTTGTYAVESDVWMPGGVVANCYWVSGRITAKQARANATLYAAAPDLFEALEFFVAAAERTYAPDRVHERRRVTLTECMNKARAALSKAGGDQ